MTTITTITMMTMKIDMQTVLIIVGTLVLVLLFFATFKKKKLSSADRNKLRKLWDHVESMSDPASTVLEAEKVLHTCFTMRGWKGTFGECLKRNGSSIVNLQPLWDAHKLRNRIAHEPGIFVSKKEADHAVQTFRRTLESFL